MVQRLSTSHFTQTISHCNSLVPDTLSSAANVLPMPCHDVALAIFALGNTMRSDKHLRAF